ncbi:MAG: O-antigen/teichoic acid export membrane protein [Planctomycetota bacterium]|jgi:O-antigen/teichoic acid export membrane protein
MSEENTETLGEPEETDSTPAPVQSIRARVKRASLWTVAAMVGSNLLRLGSQVFLAHLLFREHFSTIAVMRVFLVGVEMLSEVGIRGSVVYHKRGNDPTFLNTAWTLQIMRGVFMWIACCALAWPASVFFDRPVLLFLLPIGGLEAINNGLLSVGMFTRQRGMNLRGPVFIEWSGLATSLTVSIVLAFLFRSVFALAIGPVVGGFVRTGLSHIVFSELKLRPHWEPEAAKALFRFGKWVFLGTCAAFVAQQFLTLFLGKFVFQAIHGVYDRAWIYAASASRPLTMLQNQVMIPLFAEQGRQDRKQLGSQVALVMGRFLPACLFICICCGLFAPAFFGWFFPLDYIDAGNMVRYISVVLWFMILQHVPRSAMLSIGNSRGVCLMMVTNALVTLWGVFVGYFFLGALTGIGGVRGAIIGNAIGNIAGCVVGAIIARRSGFPLGKPMLHYSILFLALYGFGFKLDNYIHYGPLGLGAGESAFISTSLLGAPLFLVVLWKLKRKAPVTQAAPPAKASGAAA